MKFSSHRCSAILVLLLAGCQGDSDCYQIEVKPDGEAFQRKLTCWRERNKNDQNIIPFNAGQLAALAKLYANRETPAGAKKHVFTGRFIGNTPADVGGAGSYTNFTSSLGSTSSYVERFRGSDDFAAQLDKRRELADSLADLLLGWMTGELGQDPKFPRLKKFLDEDFRRDLRNLAVYAWSHQATEGLQEPFNGEFLVRAGQYFCERGYFSPQQIPLLVRAFLDDDPKPFLAHVQRLLARKMGIADDQAIPASLKFLDDFPRLKASFEKYARSTEVFQGRLKTWKSQNKEDKDAKEITPPDVVADFIADIAGMYINLFADSLDLKLSCGENPYATNGKWDEKSAAVTWTKSLDGDRTPPIVCFALWSTPDRASQESHFGKVLLSGKDLAAYVLWRRSLKPEEAKEWDQFLVGLKPGPDLLAAVKTFRFSTDPKPQPNQPAAPTASLADTPRLLILEHLGAK